MQSIPTSSEPPAPLLQHRTDQHGICILIPTYNNSLTVRDVITKVQAYTNNIIVVNDGSTDDTPAILAATPGIQLISYLPNQGKGWALRQGFQAAIAAGYRYAITLDSDGQHFASDLHAFINKLEADGPGLIIGARNMDQAGIPSKSSFGNKFSTFWFWVETGVRVPDTQSGYRLYPLQPLRGMRFFTYKYEFEIEVIVRAAWRGVPVSFVPISVYYAPGKERITHFRPFTDFSRISVLNTILVIIAFLYIKPRDFIKSLGRRETYSRLKRQIVNAEESNLQKSVAIALGVFIGIAPIWGFQIIACLFLSTLLKLNKFLVLLSAHISIPPLIPLILYLSYLTGGLLVEKPVALQYGKQLTLAAIHYNFVQYVVGSLLLAAGAAIASGLATYVLLFFFRKKSPALTS
ncbi:DUF2062 domain-containing protein [Hymenobacter saemangeumensis]|uniref:DUF2062 domain-containing protein n=1 Tax=Hymenobacter saemangeumensis TaxID=1084522 RepID=A0ABP8ITG0_9BACT